MTGTVAVWVLLAVATLLALSLVAVAGWLVWCARHRRAGEIDWRETWRRAVEEFKAAGRGGRPAE